MRPRQNRLGNEFQKLSTSGRWISFNEAEAKSPRK